MQKYQLCCVNLEQSEVPIIKGWDLIYAMPCSASFSKTGIDKSFLKVREIFINPSNRCLDHSRGRQLCIMSH